MAAPIFDELKRLEAKALVPPPDSAAEPPFDLLDVGNAGQALLFRSVPPGSDPLQALRASISTALPHGLASSSSDDYKADLESRYLRPRTTFAHQQLDHCQRLFQRDVDLASLIQPDLTLSRSKYDLHRSILTGDINLDGFTETIYCDSSLTAQNSTSMNRAPSAYSSFVRGSTSHIPFTPGGLDTPRSASGNVDVDVDVDVDVEDGVPDLFAELRVAPPGLERGLHFDDHIAGSNQLDIDAIDIQDILGAPGRVVRVSNKTASALDGQTADADQSGSQSQEVDQILGDELNTIIKVAQAKTLEAQREWAHIVDINEGFPNFYELVPDLAYPFPFELDVFQKQAVYHLEKGDSVFVAAHTSAGKTVVAEYAIALAQKHMTKAIYTSPIKALSNQKFRDFKRTYDDVGILTGDVQIRPEASCLVMTTEILRSMLYRGADIIRDVEFVIFDEVHYVNDIERGVVWEEVIIMLPDHITLILLSATVPNTKEFADWVGRTKKKNIYVISTLKRPVPLEHYLYVEKEIYKIVDSQKKFLSAGYKAAGEALAGPVKIPVVKMDPRAAARGGSVSERGGPGGRGGANRGGSSARGNRGRGGSSGGRGGHQGQYHQGPNANVSSDKNTYIQLISMLKKKTYLPAIIFTFSKKKCEEYAAGLNNVDLTTGAAEKSEIHLMIEKSLTRLKGTDKELPQILRVRDLLSRGIAVHHSGLLPILKEVVEILFTKGLVKILFATETFAMGVNAPARAVVFSGIRKHDGQSFRNLLPGEYTQMSGRAGRRGLDDTGVVILLANDELPEQGILTQMLLGTPTKLASQFRLTYNMILSLLRVEALRIEDMIKRSFSENSTQKMLPDQQRQHEETALALKSSKKLSCSVCDPDISKYYDLSYRILLLTYSLREKIHGSPYGARALTTGRVVVVDNSFYRGALAVVLRSGALVPNGRTNDKTYTVAIISEKRSGAGFASEEAAPLPLTKISVPSASALATEIISVSYTEILLISTMQIKVDANELLEHQDPAEIALTGQKLLKVAEITSEGTGLVEHDWSKIRDLEFQEQLREKNGLVKQLQTFRCTACPSLSEHYAIVHVQKSLQRKVSELAYNMSEQNLDLLPDYHQRLEVLKVLNFVDENSTVQLKGRVACEINTADELLLTELIFENVLAEYEPAEIVALLSCFVFQEKSQSEPVLTPRLEEGVAKIQAMAMRVGEIQFQSGLQIRGEDVVGSLKFGLVEVVYEWAMGMSFKQITDLTDVLEGSIVRCIVRLDETCREVRGAARLIGDAGLFHKMEAASELIKRDIVFAASLYF